MATPGRRSVTRRIAKTPKIAKRRRRVAKIALVYVGKCVIIGVFAFVVQPAMIVVMVCGRYAGFGVKVTWRGVVGCESFSFCENSKVRPWHEILPATGTMSKRFVENYRNNQFTECIKCRFDAAACDLFS